MKGLFYILLFYVAGSLLSGLCGNFLPGSVVGMLLLFAALCTRAVRAEEIRAAARFILDNMALFFVPVGVGLMTSYGMIAEHWAAIAVAVVVSTLLVLVCVGRMQQSLERRAARRGERGRKEEV